MRQRLGHPYLLLTLCVLFWSGNFVVARAMVSTVPPMALSFWRWAVASMILLPWAWRPLQRNWPLLRANLGRMLVLALLGVAGFNTLVYIGLQHTSAINGLLLQSSMPLQIIALNWLLFRQPASLREGLSILLSLSGVVLILSHGHPARLLAGDWDTGDLWIMAAILDWALYSTLLRWRPAGLEPLAFLGFILPVGALMISPLYLWELGRGIHMQVGVDSVAAILYVALFPSVLSYMFWNRGVAQVGANTAGHFIHLNPVFGSLLAVILLGEVFAWYHAVGGLVVGLAIVLTVLRRKG